MRHENTSRPWVSQEVLILSLAASGALVLGWAIVRGNWLYLAPFVVLAAIPVAVRWPVQTSLGIYALLIPFDHIAALSQERSGLTLNKLVGVGASSLLLVTGLVGTRFTRPPRATLWWFLFILWGAVTALWALNAGIVLVGLQTSVALFLLYLVAVSFRVSEKELSHIGTFAIVGGMVAAAYTDYIYSQGVSLYGVTGRASLISGERETDPNQFATSLLLPLGLVLGRFLTARGWLEKLLLLCATLVMGICLYLTMSRGSLVGLVIMVLNYLYHTRANWRAWIPAAVLGLVVIMLPEQFFQRLDMPYEDASAGRLGIWRVGLRALWEYGIVGAGLRNFPFAYDEFAGHKYGFRGYSRGAHNIYLGMWVELGIVGLFFMMAAITSQLRLVRTWRRKFADKRDPFLLGVESACLGVLASGMFLDIVWTKAFWLPWILLALYTKIRERNSVTARS